MQETQLVYPVHSYIDLDNDYDYIMSRALKSYRQHRETEKAETRRGPFKSGYLRRHPLRLKTAAPVRLMQSMHLQNADVSVNPKQICSVVVPNVNEINEVSKANNVAEEKGRASDQSRRVLHVAKVSVCMMQQKENNKTKSFLKRNSPSHPWHSHSYPSVKPIEKFVRPPHAYMSASVGGRELSSYACSKGLNAKCTPQNAAGCRSKSAALQKPKYFNDGGLFTHQQNSGNDCFVIHPDWVSESISIQKLSLTDRSKNLPRSKSMTWNGRRCNSAPPPMYRNPVTWESIQTAET